MTCPVCQFMSTPGLHKVARLYEFPAVFACPDCMASPACSEVLADRTWVLAPEVWKCVHRQERLVHAQQAQNVLTEVQTTVSSCQTPAELQTVLKRLGSACKQNTYGIFNLGESVAKKCKDALSSAAWEAAIVRRDMGIVKALDQFVR